MKTSPLLRTTELTLSNNWPIQEKITTGGSLASTFTDIFDHVVFSFINQLFNINNCKLFCYIYIMHLYETIVHHSSKIWGQHVLKKLESKDIFK